MSECKKIIEILKKDMGSIIPRPAIEEEITECQNDLTKLSLEPLPQGYIEFLKLNNGLAWNGILFFGTYVITEKDNPSGFKLMDIVTMNDDFNDRYELDEKVLLGRADEEYYAYNIETQKYEILDLTSLEIYEEYDTFEELFIDTAGRRLGLK